MRKVKLNVRDFCELNDLDSVDLNEIGVEVRAFNKTIASERQTEAKLNGENSQYASIQEWLLEQYGDCDVIQADWLMTDKILYLLLVRETEGCEVK